MQRETDALLSLAIKMSILIPDGDGSSNKRLATALIEICRNSSLPNRHCDAKKALEEMTRCLANYLCQAASRKGRVKELALLLIDVSDVILEGGSPKTKTEKIKNIGALAQRV